MAKADAVTWPQFSWVIGILVLILIAVLGGGFSVMHGDITGLTTKVGQLEINTATTNTKLGYILDELKKRK